MEHALCILYNVFHAYTIKPHANTHTVQRWSTQASRVSVPALLQVKRTQAQGETSGTHQASDGTNTRYFTVYMLVQKTSPFLLLQNVKNYDIWKEPRDITCVAKHISMYTGRGNCKIPYSRKYWWELNLAVGSQIAISNVLANLNLAVWYRITICI